MPVCVSYATSKILSNSTVPGWPKVLIHIPLNGFRNFIVVIDLLFGEAIEVILDKVDALISHQIVHIILPYLDVFSMNQIVSMN
jgi:hypothetical protein